MNLGAGMTGGVAYVLRDSLAGHGYNAHSVQCSPLEVREELWLRMVLRRHLRHTGVPRALQLLRSMSRYCRCCGWSHCARHARSAETWNATLAQLLRGTKSFRRDGGSVPPKEPVLM